MFEDGRLRFGIRQPGGRPGDCDHKPRQIARAAGSTRPSQALHLGGVHPQAAGSGQDLLPGGGVHRHALLSALRAHAALRITRHLHRTEALARRRGLHPVEKGQRLGLDCRPVAWCQKAGIVLASASPPGIQALAARGLVKRWFVGKDIVSEGDLDGLINRLAQGFKDLTAAVGRGNFVLTDFVPLRKATTAEERKFFNAEAFTLRSRYEGMEVVYVEDHFFKTDPGGVIHQQANWIRIVLHELSHLICGTVDHDDRYAHSGIGVHAGFPASKAVNNADSWAFFAADCAGVLSDGNRLQALAER